MKKISFASVKQGEFFRYYGILHIKTDGTKGVKLEGRGHRGIGYEYYLRNRDFVIPVSVKFTVGRKP